MKTLVTTTIAILMSASIAMAALPPSQGGDFANADYKTTLSFKAFEEVTATLKSKLEAKLISPELSFAQNPQAQIELLDHRNGVNDLLLILNTPFRAARSNTYAMHEAKCRIENVNEAFWSQLRSGLQPTVEIICPIDTFYDLKNADEAERVALRSWIEATRLPLNSSTIEKLLAE